MSLQSRRRLNLVLVVVVAALGTLTYFHPHGKRPSRETPLIDFATHDVTDVRLEDAGKPPLELKREVTGWWLTAPFAYGADANLVQAFLDSLAQAKATPVNGASKDLDEYGLDKPLVRLGLDSRELAFGAAEPVSGERYVMVNGKVGLVEPYVFYQATHDAYWWLEKKLLPEGARITALQLPRATLMLDKDERWQLAPRDDSVSADAIQLLVNNWQAANAIGLAPIGKGKPLGEVAVILSGMREPLRFQILKDPDFLVLARPDLGLEFQLDQDQEAKLMEFVKPAPAAATH
ncbi:MAG: DUF4340 domain-containing protein [Bacillota bacterium]